MTAKKRLHPRVFDRWSMDSMNGGTGRNLSGEEKILLEAVNRLHSHFGLGNIDSVAQLVEQLTLNQWVDSSNLSGVT